MTVKQTNTAGAHRRQFIIAREEFAIYKGWSAFPLDDGTMLSHCPALPISELYDRDNRKWILIGDAIQAEPRKKTPKEELQELGSKEISEATYSWAGRFTLIGNGQVITDGAGLGSLFYPLVSGARGILASSSISLLSRFLVLHQSTKRKLGWYGMNWFPPPSTTFEGIKKLLPDQVLKLEDLSISYLPRLFPKHFSKLTIEERTSALASSLTHIFSQLATHQAPLSLALTAGRDSRLSLAFLIAAGAKFDAYTMLHPRISRADIDIARRLSALFNIEHRVVPTSPQNKKRLADYREHTLDYTVESDRYFYSHGSFNPLDDGRLLVRSGCLEMGRNFYYEKLNNLSWEELKQDPSIIAKRMKVPGSSKSVGNALRKWCSWRERHPVGYDWRDLFYRDQRLCGWLSAIEHSLDLLESSTSIQPFASPMLFDLLLGVSESERESAVLWETLFRSVDKRLIEIPVNPLVAIA